VIDLLSQNPDHIQQLCCRLGLGTPRGDVTRVYGGFHHKVWRLETDSGSYAVKQLSADTDCRDPDTINHYNVSEAVAEAFSAHGIPAVFALRSKADYLQLIDNIGYLVHPWCNARALKLAQISEKHALQIARILARMHRANIDVPGVKERRFDVHSQEKIIQLVNRAGESNAQIAKALNKQLPDFLNIADYHRTSLQALGQHLVISHGDLDQKNVLWDAQGRPGLIDWESAQKLNPTFEVVLEALDWSGIASQFDRELFRKFIAAYRQAGGVIERDTLQASFHCVVGDWLDWLMYNVGRSIDMEDAEQRLIGTEQVHFSLATILHLQHQIPGLLAMVSGEVEYHLAESSCLI
jgi:thiamine kinase-like enzyme